MKAGFYLVLPSGARHLISQELSVSAFERACDRYLCEAEGWRYWVDRLLGLDVHRRYAWSNLDWTDEFLDAADAQYY
jgi:hypothetical protein